MSAGALRDMGRQVAAFAREVLVMDALHIWFCSKVGEICQTIKINIAMLIIRTLAIKENTCNMPGTTLDEPDFFIFYHIIFPIPYEVNVNIPILQARKLRLKAIN